MKHILNIKYLLPAFLVLMITSCDDIDEADRFIKVSEDTQIAKTDTLTVNAYGETFTFPDEQRLLIEDFTGWKCVNCPAIADFLTRKITPVYPSVLVSLHMTTNSFSANHRNGYNCASADTICNQINGSAIASLLSLPSVTINNVSFGTSNFSSDTVALENKALELYSAGLEEESRTQIGINVVPKSTNQFDISTYINTANGKHTCYLQLWLIEEELYSTLQQSPSGWLKNYLNHGVLREVINGNCAGEMVELDEDNEAVVHHTLTLNETYKKENCRVVAIVLNADRLQVKNCYEVSL